MTRGFPRGSLRSEVALPRRLYARCNPAVTPSRKTCSARKAGVRYRKIEIAGRFLLGCGPVLNSPAIAGTRFGLEQIMIGLSKRTAAWLLVLVSFAVASSAAAEMRITEYMYSGGNGEFIEFTNVGNAPVDLAGWSFSDSAEAPGAVDLSAFGTVAAGESVILTETAAADFRTAWSLCDAVKVIGGNTTNLGRDDGSEGAEIDGSGCFGAVAEAPSREIDRRVADVREFDEFAVGTRIHVFGDAHLGRRR